MERKELLGIMAAIIYSGAYSTTEGECETVRGSVARAKEMLKAVDSVGHPNPFEWHDFSECDEEDRPCRRCRYDSIPDEVKSVQEVPFR